MSSSSTCSNARTCCWKKMSGTLMGSPTWPTCSTKHWSWIDTTRTMSPVSAFASRFCSAVESHSPFQMGSEQSPQLHTHETVTSIVSDSLPSVLAQCWRINWRR